MLCPDKGSLTRMVWLVPDAALPGKRAQEPSTQPLFLVLADGQTCFSVGGAGSILSTVNGQSLSYTCSRGDLYGTPDTSHPAWTITYRPTGSSESSPIPITKTYL